MSNLCIGLDINQEAIEFIQKKLRYKNVYYCDILTDEVSLVIKDNKFDHIVIGEVIEHLDNPTMFLKILRLKLHGRVERFILTCSTAWFYKNFIYALKNKECINTDHRYWFTPYTVCKIIKSAGLDIEEFYFVLSSGPRYNIF